MDVDAFALPPGELPDLAAPGAPDVARWSDGPAGLPWELATLRLVQERSATDPQLDPPRIARMLAMLETGMFDALVLTWNARCAGTPLSEHAAVAGAARTILAPFFPNAPLAAWESEAAHARILAGDAPTSVAAGLAIGREVGARTLAARADDGADATWDGSGRLEGECRWSPTPPAYRVMPLEPMWGKVRPFVLASGDAVRPPPPPACDGEEYLAQVADLYETSKRLAPEEIEIAKRWAGGPGTSTPPGQNLHLAINASLRHGESTMRHARTMAHVAAALADAGIAAWDAKYAYWADRPVHGIERLHEPGWRPLLATPPFPGYISGHSTFSGATAQVLAAFFPDEAEQCYRDAAEAAVSRYYGGIHIAADNEMGLQVGRAVGDAVLARAALDGTD